MNNKPTAENLRKLVDQISEYRPRNEVLVAPPVRWIYELQNNPERFRRNDKDELIWLGYKVVPAPTYSNDEACFWLMANKIIPKENDDE